jgi:hypothetical protein
MPTATLHSGLFNSKSMTEPATKVPIHAHQPTNSALRRFMSVNILGFVGDGERNPPATLPRSYLPSLLLTRGCPSGRPHPSYLHAS